MRHLVPVVFLILSLLSCSGSRHTNALLKQAEDLMLAHPDSSLAILQGIDGKSLAKDSQRAYHSLLLTQALDRNSIRMVNDSILAPALNYSRYHGNAKQRLRSCYYMAVIANNAGDSEESMEWLTRGETFIPQANDVYTAGHLYNLKSRIYKSLYDYQAALDNDIKSSAYFKENQHPLRYSFSQVSIADDYYHLHDLVEAGKALDVLVPHWDSLAVFIKAQYLEARINIAAEAKDTMHLLALKDSCFSQIQSSALRPWIAVSDAYYACGMLDSALFILQNYARYLPDGFLDMDYYTRLSSIYERQGDYRRALEMRNKASDAIWAHLMTVLRSDTRFTEERYKNQIDELRDQNLRNSLIAGMIALLLIGTNLFLYFRKAWKRTENSFRSLKLQYEDLRRERDALNEAQKKSEMMNDDIRRIVNDRLALLDKVLLGHITSNPVDQKAANESINEVLRNKDEFILNTANVFAASHPEFVMFLRGHNLNQWEIGYCCLFLMGMYSKDLDPIFSRATSNKLTSTIRNKLGLSLNGTKLKTYLLDTCRELEAGKEG